MTEQKKYNDIHIESVPGSEIEITGEIPVEIVESHRDTAIKALSNELELPGFRKGNVPEDVAVKHIGEEALLKEIAERAIGDSYANIVKDEKLEVVGRPQVTITKLAPSNPIGFKIRSAVYPKIELPDYKDIAKETRKNFSDKEDVTVTDEDIEGELKRLQQMMAPASAEATAENPSSEKEEGQNGDEEKEAPEPPEINDDFAKSLGGFESLEDLKTKMKEQMLQDKKYKQIEKERLELAEAVIDKTKVETPKIFIEGELDQMVASFTDRVKKAGMEIDAYLEQAEKTIEDLRKEWYTDAEKRAKLQLIFNEIANKEQITPDKEKLEREIEHIKEHYPEAEEESVRIYVTSQMNNEKVFELLEGKDVEKEETDTPEEMQEGEKEQTETPEETQEGEKEEK